MLSQIILSKLPNLLKSSTVFFVVFCCLMNIDVRAIAQPVALKNVRREEGFPSETVQRTILRILQERAASQTIEQRTTTRLATARENFPVKVFGPKNINGQPSFICLYADGTKSIVPVARS